MGLVFSSDNVKKSDEKDPVIEKRKFYAGIFLGAILLMFICYAVFLSIDYLSLVLAIIFSILTVITNPDIIGKLAEIPVLTYYSIFLSITLFFSIDDYKNNSDMMMLLVANILVCVAVFLSASPIVCYLFIFTNFYVVVRIFCFFALSPEKDETSQYGKYLARKKAQKASMVSGDGR